MTIKTAWVEAGNWSLEGSIFERGFSVSQAYVEQDDGRWQDAVLED